MITNYINITVLEPNTGYTLTNGETYSKKVYLGTLDSPENWTEIPDNEVPTQEGGIEEVIDETVIDENDYELAGRILMGVE